MSRRTAKVAEAVREIVATTILFGMKDPRVKNVTVLWADAAPDLRSVKIYLSVRGDAKEQSLTMHGLNSARGYIQSQIADKLELRYTPILQFVLDPGAKLAAETSAILREAMAQTALTKSSEPGPETEAGLEAELNTGSTSGSEGASEEEPASDGAADEEVSEDQEVDATSPTDELHSPENEVSLTRSTAT
ncbi:MAG: 30S ribosome-binding factor RbfA [Planctomycetota bacterium]|nr:30S ribosome-binding factor RbfA [Planctomycetota bacterium]